MNNDIISHIKQIQEAARQNRLVVFVGAGVSASAGVPLWNELINEMKKELPNDIIKDETDFLKIAQL
jgi:NAD-dependent SIR2 family protein deacetylase